MELHGWNQFAAGTNQKLEKESKIVNSHEGLFITALPNQEYRSEISFRGRIQEGRNVARRRKIVMKFVYWEIFLSEEYEKGGMSIDELMPLIWPKLVERPC
jgi:hypothetical protein